MNKHGLNVTVEDDEQHKPLDVETKSLLIQTVRELLFNVVKHSGVDEAHVKLSRNKDHMQVEVTDQGKGFNVNEKDMLPAEEGGFGLFSIKERLDWLGGDLKINSVQKGKGTKVQIRFPLFVDTKMDITDEERQIKTRQPNSDSDSKINAAINIKVLLADDHKLMREGLRKLIEEEEGLTVIAEASNGIEAVNLALETSPDVIIMDINMPLMDGIEATRQIKSSGLHVRIIGLSFHEDGEVAKSILEAGASTYLTKSEVFEALCATIRSEGMALLS